MSASGPGRGWWSSADRRTPAKKRRRGTKLRRLANVDALIRGVRPTPPDLLEVAMPFLDATALESDPEGLAFLRSVLKPDPERKRPWLPLRSAGEPFPASVDTTVEII